jgi:hypothetical protein
LSPQKDNTLYEDSSGQLSNGQGIYLFDGKTGTNLLRRGLIAFDFTSIPAKATITGATLSMYLSQVNGGPQAVSLSPVLVDWGEGASDAGDPGGQGATAQPGDATWLHTFYNASFWTTPGGDFSATQSATTLVSTLDTTYTWSGSGLVADVQAWVSNPASNFGWVIRGNEITGGNAQRFNSRENSINPPQLTVTYQVECATPTPTPTATETPTPTATPKETPTATPAMASISGTATYCSNPIGSNPVADATMTLTGGPGGSTLTDGAGAYTFSGLATGLSYTVTPNKANRVPGSSGINTVDVIAVQKHFLNDPPALPACHLSAADVNGAGGVNTVDVIAIQKFFLNNPGTANVGHYQFTPASRSYAPLESDQTAQDFDTLIFGDVIGVFAE